MSLRKRILEIYSSNSIKKIFPNYEERKEQIELTLKIADCLEKNKILLAEAGTGVGKSFAYLLAGLVFQEKTNEKILISTETIALQSQLIHKDIPILEKLLNKKIKREIALGASNYVCKRKLSHVIQEGSFGIEMTNHLKEFYEWEKQTETGIKLEYKGFASKEFWAKITREADNCLGSKCPNFSHSYYFLEKKKWQEADILIVNHHLLGAHLSGDKKVLPEFHYAIIDEAHNFPEIINKSFGVSTSLIELENLLNAIYLNDKKPMLVGKLSDKALAESCKKLTRQALDLGISFFNQLLGEVGLVFQPTRVTKKLKLDGGALKNHLLELKEKIDLARAELPEELEELGEKELKLELERISSKLESQIKILESFRTQNEKNFVYWVEPLEASSVKSYKLNIQPLESKNIFQEKFFSDFKSVIFTSATLCAEKNNFQYYLENFGKIKVETIFLESPFPYEENAVLYLPKQNSLRDPNQDPEGYLEDLVVIIPKLLELTEGNAFVLFTSNKLLNDVYLSLKDESIYPLISQIELGAEKAKEKFLSTEGSVLFGVSTFWQGIDIKGDKLCSVIITKLPFQPPSDPLIEALIDEYKNMNRNSFFELQLPRAILTLKQGFGRLIRSKTDTGMVSILDPRMKTKSYGKLVLDSLPNAKQVHSFAELKKEMKRLNSLKKEFCLKE